MISTQLVLQSQSNRIHLLAGKYQLFLLSTEMRIEEKTFISTRLKKRGRSTNGGSQPLSLPFASYLCTVLVPPDNYLFRFANKKQIN